MVTRFVSEDGCVTAQLVDYYVERARGGAGAIVTEVAFTRDTGCPGRIGINNDKFIPRSEKISGGGPPGAG